jgi:hypothetical protein
MLGRYFARFEESPSRKVTVGGQVYKEYWGEGSKRAKNAARYGQHEEGIAFPEGVDGLDPFVGSLADTVAMTVAKLKATMISCGATTLRGFREESVLTVASSASAVQDSPYERPPLSKRLVPGTTPSLTPLIDDQKLRELDVELIRGTGVRALDLVRHRVELDDGQMLMADAVLLADLDVLSPKNPGSARCLWPRRVRATGR